VIAALATGSLLVLGALPAEHVHATSLDHSHKIHRHFEAHHSHEADAPVRFTDREHDTQWLTAFFTSRERLVPTAPANVTAAPVTPELPADPGARPVLPLIAPSTHDPPWIDGLELRGPPSPAV